MIRPVHLADCVDAPRPCPWVSCKHHTLLDVNEETGTIIVNAGMKKVKDEGRRRSKQASRRLASWPIKNPVSLKKREMDDDARCDSIVEELMVMEHSCLLDLVANETSYTLEEVGEILNVTRERVRQIEVKALVQIRREVRDDEQIKDLAGIE